MIIRRLSEKRLKEYWERRLPKQKQQIERFSTVGLLPQDISLKEVELVCACSLMIERKTIHEVFQAIDRYRDESTKTPFEEGFFSEVRETLVEMERRGMRSQARRLRKIGQGIAQMQNETEWVLHWRKESERRKISAIKDEPFLPQRG